MTNASLIRLFNSSKKNFQVFGIKIVLTWMMTKMKRCLINSTLGLRTNAMKHKNTLACSVRHVIQMVVLLVTGELNFMRLLTVAGLLTVAFQKWNNMMTNGKNFTQNGLVICAILGRILGVKLVSGVMESQIFLLMAEPCHTVGLLMTIATNFMIFQKNPV